MACPIKGKEVCRLSVYCSGISSGAAMTLGAWIFDGDISWSHYLDLFVVVVIGSNGGDGVVVVVGSEGLFTCECGRDGEKIC